MPRRGGKPQSTYFCEPKLLPRIRKYLDEKSPSDPADSLSIANYLQKTYHDFARKKSLPFRNSVFKALSVVIKDYETSEDEDDSDVITFSTKRQKIDGQSNESDNSFSDDAEYVQYKDGNTVNSLVTNLYTKKTTEAASSSQQQNKISEKKSTGFVKAASEPALSTMLQNDGLGFIDRGVDETTPTHIERASSSIVPPASVKLKLNNMSASSPPVVVIEDDDVAKSSTAGRNGKRKIKSSGSETSKKKALTGTDSKTSSSMTKKQAISIDYTISSVKFDSIGGNEKTIEEVQKLLIHMRYPEIYQQIGVTPPRGFLLHGPPGCGKTLLAHAIAGELELPFFKVAATELVSGVSGESEERVRDLFSTAMKTAPCVLFIDEVDAITPKRETASKDMERRIVSQLLTCLDDLSQDKDAHVLVIGATNRPDSLDPALRRAGRFDREISMGIPDEASRARILQVLCKDIHLHEDFSFNALARETPGFVGADLSSLTREAAMNAVERIFSDLSSLQANTESQKDVTKFPAIEENKGTMETSQDNVQLNESVSPMEISSSASQEIVADMVTQSSQHSKEETLPSQGMHWWKSLPEISPETLANLYVEMDDFKAALKIVQPSAKREGFATVPDVNWDDVGALCDIREELQMSILAPVKYPEQFRALGLNTPAGILLAGPPGCGKTLLAKAVANESGINFISVKGPELLNMYVGESERAVRQVFQRARNSAPCVVFFDELDALCPRRTLSGDSGSSSRIVNQMLTEMDGLEERKQVFVMGATNRPDIIDPAVLRPGRLDKTLYVSLPTQKDRIDILKTITRNCSKPHIVDVDLVEIAELPECNGFSGADLTALVKEASMASLREHFVHNEPKDKYEKLSVHRRHFDVAFTKVKPSISAKEQLRYKAMGTSS